MAQQQADRNSPKSKKAGSGERGAAGAESAALLLEWDAISPWRQEGSEHIRTGYRRETASWKDCLWSWTYLHNETVSIFSHVVGALLFLSLPYHIFHTEIPPRYAVATAADMVVCSVYFGGVAICFTLSTIFHTFMSHSPTVYARGMQLDFQGILLLMWGSTAPLAYYSFGETPSWQGDGGNYLHAASSSSSSSSSSATTMTIYGVATTVLAALCSLATFHPNIGGPRLGHARAVLFAAFGAGSFLVPIVHGVWTYGWAETSRRVGLPWIGLTVACNGFGVLVYAFKIPEKWFPRVFDILGASHQIMHIMVVFAALAYSQAVLAAFDYRHSGKSLDGY
ncbi:transcription Factor IIF- Rap30/Rap74- interaction [Apiospora arundinis]